MNPLRLEPVYIKSIWAGKRLQTIRQLEEDGIGIAREVCAYKNSENNIAEGEFQGMSIREVIDQHHEELMGNDPSDQLIRAAYMDPIDDLSIQVHPNEMAAQAVNDYEKSESWYILEAEEGACIAAGTTISDKAVLRKACEEGTLEQYITYLPVEEGDFALIPAGMLHACGKHMLAVEVGSFGGITYRLYDYGRGRELHLDKGFEVMDPTLSCTITKHPQVSHNHIATGVEHPLFHVDVIDVKDTMEINNNGQYAILICVKGEGCVLYKDKEYPLMYTQTLLIPASISSFILKGNFRILRGIHPLSR